MAKVPMYPPPWWRFPKAGVSPDTTWTVVVWSKSTNESETSE